jgi:hypothetical protein
VTPAPKRIAAAAISKALSFMIITSGTNYDDRHQEAYDKIHGTVSEE